MLYFFDNDEVDEYFATLFVKKSYENELKL